MRLKVLKKVEEATPATNSAARGADIPHNRERDQCVARGSRCKRPTRTTQHMQQAQETSRDAHIRIGSSAALAVVRSGTW